MRSVTEVTNDHDQDDLRESHQDGLMLISEIRNDQPPKPSKLVEIEMQQNADTKHFRKMQQKVFLSEIDQMCTPLNRSLDHLGQTFSCSKCDPRMLHLSRIPIEANIELRDCIQFVPPDVFKPGRFEYSLLFSGLFQYLPLSKMKEDAYQRTKKLVAKINIHNGAVAKLATLRLQQLYSRNDVSWVTKYDESQKLVYLPLHCVIKPSSCSTQARVCIAPNVLYPTQMGPVSYNSALKNISSSQPRFYRFLLQHQSALAFAVADISQQFNRCHFTYSSSLLNITLAMKSRKKLPTYNREDCDDVTLHPLRHGVCGFGGKQTPQVAQYCQQSSVKVFRIHNSPLTKEDEFLTNMVETILLRDCWMDDMFIYIGLSLLFDWLDVCGLDKPTWSESFDAKDLETFVSKIKKQANDLLVVVCAHLTRVLQFSGFKIKMFNTRCPIQQKRLDILISEQKIGLDDENFIEVKKPTQRELHEQMRYLSPHTDFPDYEPEVEKEGVPHLGLLYDEGQVKLLKTTLSFVYSLKGRKVKSPDFKNHSEFAAWQNKINPQYSRRSLFSLVASTQDATGRHLALYRARMKLLIRGFLKRKPSCGWESLVSEDERKQLLFNIELYFYLVEKTVQEPSIAKYCTRRSILALSDASDSLYAISISVVYHYCLNGVTQHQASHLCLIPYSAHVQMVNVLWIELAGYCKLLSELAGYVLELKSLGIEIPSENIFLASDSMVLIKLLRSKVTHLQKSSCHKVAKILIQMNTMSLNSWENLYWADQKIVNFYPDLISKKYKAETCQSVLKIYDKLFDFGWLTSGLLPNLPGLHTDLPEPKKAEIEELQERHVLQSEWENFCRQKPEEQNDIITLSAAARCNVACSDACKTPDTPDTPITPKITPKPPSFPACPNNPNLTDAPTDWKNTLTLLIQRKFSYGFNSRGPVGVLLKCLEFVVKLKFFAQMGASGRKERQRRRKERYLNRPTPAEYFINPFQKGHDLMAKALNPLSLGYGQLDEHLQSVERAGEDLQAPRSYPKVTASRIFHLLTTSFQARDKVKYFKNIIQRDTYGQEVSLLVGRRQRNNFEPSEGDNENKTDGIKQTRLRQIEPNSIFEQFILSAAHQAGFNNLSKAKISIFSLNVYILGLEEKLRKLQMSCSCCNLIRAQRHRQDDLLQNDMLGPSSQLFRVKQWQKGTSFHMIDLAGPAHTYIGNAQSKRKFFILLGLQLPLKQLSCIPIKDYSSQSLYLGLLEYAAKIGGRLDLIAADAGSQIGPFQNSAMGYTEDNVDGGTPLQSYNWTNMILGKRKRQLEDNHIFLKIISGAHKHLAPVESCVAILKYTLASLNRRLTTPMDVYQWNYALRLTEKTVISRPIAASRSGRLWTPGCLLNLMGKCQNDDIADFRPQAQSDTVIDQLQNFEENMIRIKTEVAYVLLDTLIWPSFFEKLTNDEKVKRRAKSKQVNLSDVFFCPLLFSKTFHTTKSLLRLVHMNDAGTGGVFTKTGKPRKDKLVSRDFSYLYFICEGSRNTIIGDRWRPTFNISEAFQKILPDEGMIFVEPDAQEIDQVLNFQSDYDVDYDVLMGNSPTQPRILFPTPDEEEGEDPEGGGEEDKGGQDDPEVDPNTGEKIFFSRFGRKLQKTKFYGI